jgi:hypothetical protein
MADTIRIRDHSSLDMLLAFYAAPTVFGIKPASLFWCKDHSTSLNDQIDTFNRLAKGKGLFIERINETRKRMGLFVCHRKHLYRYLNEAKHAAFLQRMGYSISLTPEEKLAVLFERFKTCFEFPHEIGLFLGYPIHDVEGYIKNKGRNYILRGSWLVYSNAEYAKRLFLQYKICQKRLVNHVMVGKSIYENTNWLTENYTR